jgi:hypothetical protein
MPEPIEIRRGVYTKPGGGGVMGLCIVIDSQDAQWEVIKSDQYTTVIKIEHGAKWNVEEYIDQTGKRKLQIFCEGAKLDSLSQQFTHPTEKGYANKARATDNEWPELKIFYTTPDDKNTPPIKKP